VVFDNALLTQSRLILLDPFLLLFGFISLLFYFKYRLKNSDYYLLLATCFAGLAISVKWTGLSFIALPLLVETSGKLCPLKTDFTREIRSRLFSLVKFASFFIISLAFYCSVLVLHFMLLPKSGPGDAFMKPNFRENSIVRNIVDLNIEMYKSNQRLSAGHPYGSAWYTWPFMTRPIYYWVKDTARIYFLGNPIIWWSGAIALIFGIKHLVLSINKRKLDKVLAMLLGGYFINLLPFIGVKRVMFLYHYLTALIFAILILIYLVDQIYTPKTGKRIFAGLVLVSLATFLFFAPLSYGLPLSNEAYNLRVWFSSWR